MYLVDASGNEVAAYDYDPYGKVIASTGDLAGTNPLRYRGYYYDTETGFYYLQSRYYDPEICRFINTDGYSSTGAGFLGYNMFAYCNNTPPNFIDNDGAYGIAITILLVVLSAAINTATSYIAAKATQQEYTIWDAGVAATAGAANMIPYAGPYIAGAISGLWAWHGAYKSGATAEETVLCVATSAIATTASIGNLANLGTETVAKIAATSSADLVFGTGYACSAAATGKAVSRNAESRSAASASSNLNLGHHMRRINANTFRCNKLLPY